MKSSFRKLKLDFSAVKLDFIFLKLDFILPYYNIQINNQLFLSPYIVFAIYSIKSILLGVCASIPSIPMTL